MSHTLLSTEGIVLRSISFKDHDQILSIFTIDAGLIKVFYNGGRGRRRGGEGGVTPLNKVEVVYRERSGEIFSCHEITVIETYSSLRKELQLLEVACDLLQAILTSQMAGKAAPQLYLLLCFYLKKIPLAPNPWILSASFRMKLLAHDGLISVPFICSVCQNHLHDFAFITADEQRCLNHQLPGDIEWLFEELQFLYRIVASQSCQEILQSQMSPALGSKICAFFDSCIEI